MVIFLPWDRFYPQKITQKNKTNPSLTVSSLGFLFEGPPNFTSLDFLRLVYVTFLGDAIFVRFFRDLQGIKNHMEVGISI